MKNKTKGVLLNTFNCLLLYIAIQCLNIPKILLQTEALATLYFTTSNSTFFLSHKPNRTNKMAAARTVPEVVLPSSTG